MFVYNYRIFDRYKRPVASLAVLADSSRAWRPNQFGYELFGCKVDFRFPVIKLVDYQQHFEEIVESRNPFATVVLAHLAALQTRDNRVERKAQKLALVRRLYEKELSREQVLNLFAFLDWMLTLPLDLEAEFLVEVEELEEEQRMKYVTSFERNVRREQLLKSIPVCLRLKFGSVGQSLLSEIENIEDWRVLETILEAIETTNTVSELRQIYQPTTGE